MRLPAWCRHTTLAISCWHCLELARASADRASLPTISHLGVKLLSVGWGAPSTLPVSPCGKPAAPASASPAAAPLRFWRPGAAGGGVGGIDLWKIEPASGTRDWTPFSNQVKGDSWAASCVGPSCPVPAPHHPRHMKWAEKPGLKPSPAQAGPSTVSDSTAGYTLCPQSL